MSYGSLMEVDCQLDIAQMIGYITPETYTKIENDIAKLKAYYDKDWRKDFEADEAGKLPQDLKRGVLSEDGLYDLLTDYQCLKDQIRAVE